jgi:hypothetical protein
MSYATAVRNPSADSESNAVGRSVARHSRLLRNPNGVNIEPTMRDRSALVVGVFATAVMCVQNAGSGLAFGWALLHGAGPAAVVAFLPLGIGLGTLWGAFRYLNRSNHRHASALFTGLAVAIVLLSEMLLPATPLDTWRSQRAMKAADVRNIGDEVLLSAKGNPIGMRVTYEVIFPQTVVANVHLWVARVQGEVAPYMQSMEFGRHSKTIDPEPSSKDISNVFERKRLYKFTVTLVPGFLEYNAKTQQPCLRFPAYSEISEAEIVSAIKKRGRDKYRMGVSLTSDVVPATVHHGSYVTSREYDLEAMYQTIVTEGHQRCSSNSYERWHQISTP